MRSTCGGTRRRWRQCVAAPRKKETRDILLVVDDSPETLRMLTDAIEEAGMTVLVAREGEYALSIIERVLPDIILMDALMPGTDGFETCRRLKQNKALAHVPVIFMTGATPSNSSRVWRPAASTTSPSRSCPASCWRAFASILPTRVSRTAHGRRSTRSAAFS